MQSTGRDGSDRVTLIVIDAVWLIDHPIAGHRPLDVAGAEPVITDDGNDEPGHDYQRTQRDDAHRRGIRDSRERP